MLNQNSMAIAMFCSHLCLGVGVKALEPKEWGELAKELREKNIQPAELLEYSAQDFHEKLGFSEVQTERIIRLIERGPSLSFEISKYKNMGIGVVTRADAAYPGNLKRALVNLCPPLFYYAGNLELLKGKSIGYVGSRTVSEKDTEITKKFVAKTTSNGYAVVSGGAKGVDSIAEEHVLSLGGSAIAYLSDSMLRKIKKPAAIKAIQEGRLLYLSVVKPDSGFNAGIAMMRNKYIYAQSSGTVIIRADYNKGGTWSGATDSLKNNYCPTICWNNKEYSGNKALIAKGAIPIDEAWDGNMENLLKVTEEQMSLFD